MRLAESSATGSRRSGRPSTDLFRPNPKAEGKLQSAWGRIAASGIHGVSGDQIVTEIFKLSHENASNLVSVLRPLISANNLINSNAGNNSLVITDYANNLARLGSMGKTFEPVSK